VSGETDLEKLIATVMRLGLEHAGAERGLLILPSGDAHRIEAAAWVGDEGVTVALHQAAVTAADLPESVFHYVLRTRETVLLHDASSGGSFSDDYVRRHHARSLLCMPLLKQGRLLGLIYLENNAASGVFTPGRVALLKLLASEAAILIESARLYRDVQEREVRLRRLIDANIIGIFIWHADGRVFDANDEFLRIIGQDREELVSGRLRWTDFTLPENRERDLRVLEELSAGGGAKATERELLRKDGTRVPVLTGGTMFEGVPDEGVAFVADLTERRRAEQVLRERERESRLILETIPGLVATLNPSGEVDAINHELVAFCGQPLEAMKEWGTNGTVHPEDLSHIVPLFTRAIASGEPYDFEARVRRFDGVYRWLQVRGLPLRDTSGQIVRWYVLLSDVDDRRRAEEALNRARAELAHMARVTMLSALTASIAHEINQPIAAVTASAGACLRLLNREQPEVQRAREAVMRIEEDGMRAAEIIAHLKSFYKEDLSPRRDLVSVNDLVGEMPVLLRTEADRHSVVMRTELAADLPAVSADRVLLQQVLMNLMLNGMEATTGPGGELTIRTLGDSGAVLVSVSDAGEGIPAENMDQIFNAFFSTKVGGTGMGLAISRTIIESHGGRLWVTPNPGRGVTFHFTLPTGAET